jgi:hypothetical protein
VKKDGKIATEEEYALPVREIGDMPFCDGRHREISLMAPRQRQSVYP